MSVSDLLPPHQLRSLASSWLHEDAPQLDVGGCVVGSGTESAVLLCKQPGGGVLCGCPFVDAVFAHLGCRVRWLVDEGALIAETPSRVATVSGPTRQLLLGERVALNVLSRASGVATAARRMVERGRSAGWRGRIAGTRKTTPGFRLVEKYALVVGDADAHRYDLGAMVMLKDNHTWSAGSTQQAVATAKKYASTYTKIQVECRNLAEALEAIEAGCDSVMLDNFTTQMLHKTAKAIKTSHPQITIEASGGISEENVDGYFGPEIDVISCGRLTQGYATIDFSFKLIKDDKNPFNPLV